MDVSVEDRHRAKPLQVGESLLAVVCAPAPFRIDGPQRDVREDHDGRARRQRLHVLLQPPELLPAKRPEAAGLQVLDVDEADEVGTVTIEALPATSDRALAEPIEIAASVVFEDV